jgi:hypothetical protein
MGLIEVFALANAQDFFDGSVAAEDATAAVLEQSGHALILDGELLDGRRGLAADDHLAYGVVYGEHLEETASSAESEPAAFGTACAGHRFILVEHGGRDAYLFQLQRLFLDRLLAARAVEADEALGDAGDEG